MHIWAALNKFSGLFKKKRKRKEHEAVRQMRKEICGPLEEGDGVHMIIFHLYKYEILSNKEKF